MGENVNVREVVVHSEETGELVKYPIPYGMKIAIADGDRVERGQGITEGSKAPADIMRICGLDAVYDYIIKEIQKVYRSQSCDVNDKHIEIIARQMTRRFRISENGDTDLLVGSIVDMTELEDENNRIIARREAGERELRLAEGEPVLLGITKAALQTESFLSAASFQETTKVLTDAAIKCKVDRLIGLKENVIIGKLIPAGTGMAMYHNVDVKKNEPVVEATEDDILA
jgi:DNA-directed RNA polymerase subunit beta'